MKQLSNVAQPRSSLFVKTKHVCAVFMNLCILSKQVRKQCATKLSRTESGAVAMYAYPVWSDGGTTVKSMVTAATKDKNDQKDTHKNFP